ncbi:MAG: hypothetical protein LBH09_08660 [Peptococcaceae bacterium]|nr:hypothetical protein [Peptococcaceae bacterium]
MKVGELRTALSGYDASELQEIVVTLYKMIPKSRKESDGLDGLLQSFSKEKTKPAKKEIPADFATLKLEVETFIQYANDDLYYVPNRIVSKDKRSKWRFEVKRFIKGLIATHGEDSEAAALLLTNVYNMMSYACNYWTFSSDNPFSAVGYRQTDFLQIVLSKIFYNGFSQESIKEAVFLALDSNVDRDTLHLELLRVLVSLLNTPDTKEMALVQCLTYAKGYGEYQAAKKKFKYPLIDGDYRASRHKNLAVELYLLLKISLHEYDEGIAYYWKNYKERDKEITLYCLLTYFLSDASFNALWLREYEKAVAEGIEPRDYLQEGYKKRKGA